MEDQNSVRLRASVFSEIYENNFKPDDVGNLVHDYLTCDERQPIGDLWLLQKSLPISELPEILDRVSSLVPSERRPKGLRHSHEVESFFEQMLERLLCRGYQPKAEQISTWLFALHQFRGGAGTSSRYDVIRKWLSDNPSTVRDSFRGALEKADCSSLFLFWHDFHAIFLQAVNSADLIRAAFSVIQRRDGCSERDRGIYELVLAMTVSLDPPQIGLFEDVYKFGRRHQALREVTASLTKCEIEDWRQEERVNRIDREHERESGREQNRRSFEEDKDSIRNGRHLGWLGWLANVYRAEFSDVERNLSPRERLVAEIGVDNADVALRGFAKFLQSGDYPCPKKVAEMYVNGKYFRWWFALVASMDEQWVEYGHLHGIDEDKLRAALAIDVLHPTYERLEGVEKRAIHGWKEALLEDNADLVRSTYLEVAKSELSGKSSHAYSVVALFEQNNRIPNQYDAALELLTLFPNAQPTNLRGLVSAALCTAPQHKDLLELCERVLASRSKVRGERRGIWLAVWFLVDFDSFGDTQKRYISRNVHAAWTIKDIQEDVAQRAVATRLKKLTTPQIVYLIREFVRRFKNVDFPPGGWSGSANPWDGAEYVRKLVNELSARSDNPSREALKKLPTSEDFHSYADQVKHALASQAVLRRQEEYRQPDWQDTIETLSGGRPANTFDLHALAVDHLQQIANSIRGENTDKYKAFWNEDRYGQPSNPKNEASCRDRLVDLLRQVFSPIEVRVEPEGHMVADKRADIVLLPPPGAKLPIELKRDNHADVWNACANQLDRLYTRDSEASGFGVYGVFWFGRASGRRIPKPPQGIGRPESAKDMEAALRSIIPDDDRRRLEVVVIDVSKP